MKIDGKKYELVITTLTLETKRSELQIPVDLTAFTGAKLNASGMSESY